MSLVVFSLFSLRFSHQQRVSFFSLSLFILNLHLSQHLNLMFSIPNVDSLFSFRLIPFLVLHIALSPASDLFHPTILPLLIALSINKNQEKLMNRSIKESFCRSYCHFFFALPNSLVYLVCLLYFWHQLKLFSSLNHCPHLFSLIPYNVSLVQR